MTPYKRISVQTHEFSYFIQVTLYLWNDDHNLLVEQLFFLDNDVRKPQLILICHVNLKIIKTELLLQFISSQFCIERLTRRPGDFI